MTNAKKAIVCLYASIVVAAASTPNITPNTTIEINCNHVVLEEHTFQNLNSPNVKISLKVEGTCDELSPHFVPTYLEKQQKIIKQRVVKILRILIKVTKDKNYLQIFKNYPYYFKPYCKILSRCVSRDLEEQPLPDKITEILLSGTDSERDASMKSMFKNSCNLEKLNFNDIEAGNANMKSMFENSCDLDDFEAKK